MTGGAPRIALIGARRQRQGLGPFVARDLAAAGAEVCAFLATTPETRDAARRELAALGIEARGYTDLHTLLDAESLDALAVLSPAETHESLLGAALDADLHVLCEKPLLWGRAGIGEAAAHVVQAFRERGLLLHENCQWPYTLGAFEELHPGALAAPPKHFAMELQPGTTGLAMLGDTLSHPLSLLQALVPGEGSRVAELRFSSRHAEAETLVVDFDYCAPPSRVTTQLRLERSSRRPRHAAYAIDGRPARRLVSSPDYRLCFSSGEHRVPLPDPLTALVADFVSELRGARSRHPARGAEIAQRVALLEQIVTAYAQPGGAS